MTRPVGTAIEAEGGTPAISAAPRTWFGRYPAAVVLAWVVLAVAANLVGPQLESVIKDHSRSFFPADAPAGLAAARIGQAFNDSHTNNVTYLVFEADHPLGMVERNYYQMLVAALRADHAHVESMMDLWSEPLAAPISESADHRVTYLLLRLAGQLGSTKASESVTAVRELILQRPPPQGLRAYVSGPGASLFDEFHSLNRQMIKITVATIGLIALLLLVVYRSVITESLPLMTVGLSLAVARTLVAALGGHALTEVSLFSAALMATMLLGAGTDYSIFLLGRYHENRCRGVDVVPALYAAYRSVAPVIVGSAVTIAGALFCLTFAKVGLLRSAGIPCGIGILVAMAASLTVMPALIALAARRGWVEPRPSKLARRWRRLGTAVARWPAPILVTAATALAACGISLLGIRIGFNELTAQPETTESSRGYHAMDQHFPPNRLLPEIVLIESDHDVRNPAGLIAIERVTRQIMAIPGVRTVQSASRPAGTPLDESALTHQAGVVGGRLDDIANSLSSQRDSIDRARSTLSGLSSAVDQLDRGLTGGSTGLQHISTGITTMRPGVQALQDNVRTVSDYMNPLRNFVNATPDCRGRPICALVLKVTEPMDGAVAAVGQLSDGTAQLIDGSASAAGALGGASEAIATLRASVTNLNRIVDSLEVGLESVGPQFARLTDYLNEMSVDFEHSGEGGFYLPQRALDDPRFARIANLMFSADGHATRMLVYGDGDAWGTDGAGRAQEIRVAVAQATKEGTLVNNRVQLTGVGSATSDLEKFAQQDNRLLATVAAIFVFLVVAVMLRSPVAGIVVVTTVVASYASALGASTLIWQHLFGHQLHWAAPSLAFIALVAVGADYNLLLAMRLKDEAYAGLKTAMIRAFGGTGGVVTTAGIVFGLTMFAMLASNVIPIAQVGSTIGVGLIIDTLIVRTFVVPAIAVLLGRWFWWPQRISTARHAERLPPATPVRPAAITLGRGAANRASAVLRCRLFRRRNKRVHNPVIDLIIEGSGNDFNMNVSTT